MFSKILKTQRMIQSLEIKYVTNNKPNITPSGRNYPDLGEKMSRSLEIKYLPQNMSKNLEIKISKSNNCQKD